jgi:leader peptidase (prepilin peptidase)/N-methyltransferase
LVEALCALLFALLAARYGLRPELAPALVFTWAMVFVTLVDLDARIIPDAVTLPGTALGVLAALITPLALRDALLGAALGFCPLARRGITASPESTRARAARDIKFAAMLGRSPGVRAPLTSPLASVRTVVRIACSSRTAARPRFLSNSLVSLVTSKAAPAIGTPG